MQIRNTINKFVRGFTFDQILLLIILIIDIVITIKGRLTNTINLLTLYSLITTCLIFIGAMLAEGNNLKKQILQKLENEE